MSYETPGIEQINIMIDTNIPNQKPIKLTSKLFYQPVTKLDMQQLSEIPYFTNDYEYPLAGLNKLAISENGYMEILKFFFNENTFVEKINEYKLYGKYVPVNKIDDKDDKDEKKRKRDAIAKANIELMLQFLFPTKFPFVNNYSNSFDQYFLGKTSVKLAFNKVYTPTGADYCYMKIDNKPYTVTNVIWINDIINHPVYREFFDSMRSQPLWGKKQKEDSINRSIEQLTAILNDTTGKYVIYDDVPIDTDIQINFIKKFQENIDTIYPDITKMQYDRDINKKTFVGDLQLIQKNIKNLGLDIKTYKTEFDSEMTKVPKINEENQIKLIRKFGPLYKKISDINTLYVKLKENKTFTLLGIPELFEIRLNALLEEAKAINENISVITTSEGPPLKDKIKSYISPERESSNTELQKYFSKYNNKQYVDPVNRITDLDILVKDIYELITIKKNNRLDDIENRQILNTDLCIINKNKIKDVHYEIYVYLELIEGEINDKNKSLIECEYRGLGLGQGLENWDKKRNKYELRYKKIFLTIPEIMAKAEGKPLPQLPAKDVDKKNNIVPPPPPPPPSSGGYTTIKNSNIHKYKYKKNKKTGAKYRTRKNANKYFKITRKQYSK